MGLVDFDPFKVIKAALKCGGDFADVYVEDGVNNSIVCEEERIEKVISGRDRGAGIRVIADLKTYYAYTNDLTEKGLLEVASVVANGVRGGGPGCEIGPVRKEVAKGFEIKKMPPSVELSEKVKLVRRADETARGFDKRISQVRVVYGDGLKKFQRFF